jgi:hypothetical protein
MGVYISPAAAKEIELPAKPESAKKEYDRLIREIRTIAANSRLISGDFVDEAIKQTKDSADTQIAWSRGGTVSQLLVQAAGIAVSGMGLKSGDMKLEQTLQLVTLAGKIGDVFQGACSTTQVDQQANQQRIQQAIAHYNAFDQRMQALIQAIDTDEQRRQQAEQEQFMSR